MKKQKMLADYHGSYHNPERATEEMKRMENQESGMEKVYTNVGYDEAKPPPIKLSTEQQEEYEKQMKVKFGGLEKLNDDAISGEPELDFDDEFTALDIKQLRV